MGDARYTFINDREELANKINGLEQLARKELLKNNSLTPIDCFLMGSIDKSLKLIDSFIFAFNTNNITVLASLTRIQLDCVLRTFATTLVQNADDFCLSVFKGKRINTFQDKDNQKLTDKHLCEELSKILHLDVYKLYQQVSDYIHLSSRCFLDIATVSGKNKLKMFISKNNDPSRKTTFERFAIELANHFYYFGRILIEVNLNSWLKQKTDEGLN